MHAAIPENCTTVIGAITIAENFTGPFILNGITDFAGSIASSGSLAVSDVVGNGGGVPSLTSFEMDDLSYFGDGDQNGWYNYILLENVPNLKWVNITSATFISSLHVGGFSQATFQLPRLVSSKSIEIIGGDVR